MCGPVAPAPPSLAVEPVEGHDGLIQVAALKQGKQAVAGGLQREERTLTVSPVAPLWRGERERDIKARDRERERHWSKRERDIRARD